MASVCAALFELACGQDLDAGSDSPHGLLPIDNRNPLVLYNDGPRDNGQGEYAIALASAGKIELAGIVVTSGHDAPNVSGNLVGWTAMVTAARASGMGSIPDPIASDVPALVRPADNAIDDTQPNGSPGAQLIVKLANQLSQPFLPLVVATGGRLTDVADAYLLDHRMGDRVVVVSALGSASVDGTSAVLGAPNGTLDPWADEIVVRKFRYVQVDAVYKQTSDFTIQKATALPANAFGDWIRGKQPNFADQVLPDQITVMAAAVPQFAVQVEKVAEATSTPPAPGHVPALEPSVGGRGWLVTQSNNASATEEFWQALMDPATYRH